MLSIIIPAYNEEEYLPKLLKCIKNQTCKDYEVIVADADSKDKTRQVAKKHGCKIVKGGLPAVGRNSGAKIAKGDILLFLDADVWFDDNFLKNAIDEFQKRKLDVAGFYIHPIGDNVVDKIFFAILFLLFIKEPVITNNLDVFIKKLLCRTLSRSIRCGRLSL